MKIVIGYPPLDSPKGIPFLGQNRQFQWATAPWNAYPIVPAWAATMLKKEGFEVAWLDGISKGQKFKEWFEDLKKEKPDLLVIETKTPVVKKHWKIISKLKTQMSNLKIVLVGDHVTALPEESLENSPVDFVLTGGDYDFLLVNLCKELEKSAADHRPLIIKNLEPGIWWREKIRNSKFALRNSGKFLLNHNLDSLPFIDRELTCWQLYAYKNSNYSRTPGTYTMFGRDCWWGKCSFCVKRDTEIYTNEGPFPIKEIVDKKMAVEVLTHQGKYRKIVNWYKRKINEEVIDISTLYLPFSLTITKNHKVYCLPKKNLMRCSKKNGWSYWCKPERISKFLNCDSCDRKYFQKYKLTLLPAEKIKKGDFLAIPLDKKTKDIKSINIPKILEIEPTILKTPKKISPSKIKRIFSLRSQGFSQRAISREVKIDRETVKRYLCLGGNNSLEELTNPLVFKEGISFTGGVHKIPLEILLDDDFLFLAGLYLAEGHVSYLKNRPNSATIGWTFNIKEKLLVEETKKIFKKTFNIELNQTLNVTNKTYQLYIGSTIIARVFKILFGSNSYDKKIPFSFLNLPLEKQRSLLKGIFNGDGHLRKREKGGAEYILETVSKTLAFQVFYMLLRFKAIPSLKIIKPLKPREVIKYKITLFNRDILRVFPEIRIKKDKLPYKKGIVMNDYILVPVIRTKKKKFKGFVYNLEVEGDHSYTANLLAVKNCSWTTLYPSYRVMSPKRALDEVGWILENWPVKEIMDDSGTFPVGDWLREFCEGMINRGYNKKIKIDCNMRFNNGLKQKDYNLMAKAGFRFLLFGLESANQKTLDRINKNLKVSQIGESLRMAKKAGLWPHITVMVGYPWETKQDALRTLNMAREFFKKGWVDTLQATIVVPYPGTPLFEECKKNGWLKTLDWDRYDMKEPVMKTPMRDEEIMELVRSIYSSFLTPQFLWRKFKDAITDREKAKYYAWLGWKWISKRRDFSGQ